MKLQPKSVRQQFADTMCEVGLADPQLVVLVGDISHYALQPFAEACPGRYYNIGICEPTIVSMAAGLAKTGFVPVAHTIAPFLIERSFEQIKLDFCYHKLAGNLVSVGGAFDYSNLGCTHHCYDDFALLGLLEGTELVYPGNAQEFDLLFRQAYRSTQLTLFRLPGQPHDVEWSPEAIRFGQAVRVLDGQDLTILTCGPHLRTALDAIELLRSDGWRPEVLHVHTIKPLDTVAVRESLARTKRVLVVEEHARAGGLGAAVLQATCDLPGIDYGFLCLPDRFIREYGRYEDHLERLGFTPHGIAAKVRAEFGAPVQAGVTG